jgi:hypothetical protein
MNIKTMILRYFKQALVFAAAVMIFTACEDEPPTNYIPKPFIEAYLFVDRPIEDVIVMITQPLNETYTYGNGTVTDADVIVKSGSDSYSLQYHEIDGVGSYFLPDTTVLIKPGTVYDLEVRLKSGEVITASTTTPDSISWVTPPKDVIQYTKDTINLPIVDSLNIQWTPGNVTEYIIRIRVLDTLDYGAYLNPPREEFNERTNNEPFEDGESPTFYSFTRWGFIQVTQVPTVWKAFKWYGKNEVAIIAPDRSFLQWFKSTLFSGRPRFNSEYSNVQGGEGVFASGSIITWDTFLLKWK